MELCGHPVRMEALRRYDIVGSEIEQEYDDITRLAANICQTPISLITFVEPDRQWIKSAVGTDLRETPVDISFCAHGILDTDILEVPDATQDDRFADNPLVQGEPNLRFYAGALLRTKDGQPLGRLCVLDTVPRTLNDVQRDALRTLAAQVMSLLELRFTTRRQAEAMLALEAANANALAAQASAEEANRAKDRFLAVLSHELRTPLTPVFLTAAEIAKNTSLPAETREQATTIQRNVEHSVRLIDDLLNVSRIVAGKLELVRAPMDLKDVLVQVVTTCSVEAETSGVKVYSSIAAACTTLNADAGRLRQVFLNLLRNAIKFTPRGGEVRVGLVNDTPTHASVRIEDTGIGMDELQQQTMFDAFSQGKRAITARESGLGLGLAIAKGFVDAHGGSIDVHSDGHDRGTCMTVKLPIQTMTVIAAPARRAETIGRPLNILLVEDHHDSLLAMTRLLRRLGHGVTPAANVSSALQVSQGQPLDLLISDIDLPDGTGLDLIEKLLAERPIRGIALTGFGAESDIARTRQAGFGRHLTKPINFDELRNALDAEAAELDLVP